MQNPNRFIRGLSDLSEIVDPRPVPSQVYPLPSNVEVVYEEGSSPIVVPIEGGSSGASSPQTLVEFETTLTKDGEQVLSIGANPGPSYTLYVNGLRQSKTAYSVSGTILSLPTDLNVLTGDVISLEYFTN